MRAKSKTQNRWAAVCLACLAGLLPGPAALWSQQVTAAITGRITDPSGAPVPDAKVTATDVARGTAWPTTTNAEGVYNLPRLPVGTYNVRAEKEGFQAAQSSGVVLRLNDVARLDFPLQVGPVTQSVEVTTRDGDSIA